MSTLTIEIKAPELVSALNHLSGALINAINPTPLKTESPAPLPQTFPQMAAQQSVVQAPITSLAADNGAHSDNPAYAQPTAPVTPPQYQPQQPVYSAPQPQQYQQAVPTAPPAAPPPPQQAPAPMQAPVAAPVYAIEQLSIAAAPLMDAGKGPDLVNLLHAFGVQAVNQLPKDAYGAFATELRKLGAKI